MTISPHRSAALASTIRALRPAFAVGPMAWACVLSGLALHRPALAYGDDCRGAPRLTAQATEPGNAATVRRATRTPSPCTDTISRGSRAIGWPGHVAGARPRHALDTSFRGRIPPGDWIALRYDPAAQQTALVVGSAPELTAFAEQAVARSPAWLRDRLADRLARLDAGLQDVLGQTIVDVQNPRLVDEVAFGVAAVSLDHLEDEAFDPRTLLANAEAIYEADACLHYVELVDVGLADVDDDYHTTARYRLRDEAGGVVEQEIEAAVYYHYVAMPTFGNESLAFVDPVTGKVADPSEGGAFWRNYYLFQDADPKRRASTHYGLEYPTLVDDAMVSGWGPSAQGVLRDFDIDPIPLVVDAASSEPTLVVFSYPGSYYDANVIATTMPLELAYRSGGRALLENVLQLGNASATLPTHHHIAIIKDRDPWGEATVEEALAAVGYSSVDVLSCSQVGDLLTGGVEYTKIVVPSAQPRACYEALAAHRPAIDEWLLRENYGLQTVFEFHGAVDRSQPGDHWHDLDLVGGFSCSDQATDSRDQLATAGYPELLDVLASTDHVVTWLEERQSWSGHRPLDRSSSAIDLIGYFASQHAQDRCSEIPPYYRGPDGTDAGSYLSQTLRSPYPQRSLYLHFGNCGEAQDVLSASSRAGLLPVSNVGGFVDDHVWNLIFVNGQWVSYTFSRSDGGTGLGGDLYVKPDAWAAVLEWRGDGAFSNRTARYTDTVSVDVSVVDSLGRPVDGALVFTASDDHGTDPDTLVFATVGWTDAEGQLSIDVGARRNYYLGVVSSAGLWPGPEPNKVSAILTAEQSKNPGDGFVVDVTLESEDAPRSWRLELAEPAGDTELLSIHVGLTGYLQALEAENFLFDLRFNEFEAGGEVELVLLDEDNFARLQADEPFQAMAHWPAAETLETQVDVPVPVPGQGIYLVASNLARFGHSSFAALSFGAIAAAPPAELESPATTEGGECGCRVPGGAKERGAGPLLVACLLLGWVAVRRRSPH